MSLGKFILGILILQGIYTAYQKYEDRVDQLECDIAYLEDKLEKHN